MSKSGSRNVWEQLAAIFKYELLWNIRKKKFLVSLIIVFGLASLQLFLPLIQGPLNPDPTFIIDNIWPPNLVIVLFAIVVSMNSISGEFEDGTIEPLASKPISRWMIYFGKLLTMAFLLFVIYSIFSLYLAGGGLLLYGSQEGLSAALLLTPVLTVLSTLVWVGVSLVFGSWTKSSVVAAVGTIGIFIGISMVGGIVTTVSPESGPVQNYLPGTGESGNVRGQFSGDIPVTNLSVSTGTDHIAKQFFLYTQRPSAEVEIKEYKLQMENMGQGGSPIEEVGRHSYSMSEVLIRSLLVAIAYAVGLNLLAWFSFERADISMS